MMELRGLSSQFTFENNYELESPSVRDLIRATMQVAAMPALERYTSNPLTRQTSNISVASQEGNAHFVPFGPGHEELANNTIDFDDEMMDDNVIPLSAQMHAAQIRTSAKQSTTPPQPPLNNYNCNELAFPSPTPLNLQPIYPNDNLPNVQSHDDVSLPLQNQPTRFSFEQQVIEQNMDANTKNNDRFKRQMAPQSVPFYDFSALSVPDIIKQNLSLAQLMKHSLVAKLIKDGAGSRFIQEKLKNEQAMHAVLRHLIVGDELLHCSTSKYGNYVMQKFFEHGDGAAHDLLFEHLLRHNMIDLSFDEYGCRVLQEGAMTWMDKQALIPLIGELAIATAPRRSLLQQLITGNSSNHVIQKILALQLEYEHVCFIIDEIDGAFDYYSKHVFGCRIVQSIIKYYGAVDDKRLIKKHFCTQKKNINYSAANIVAQLSKSKYGNYVIQDILKLRYGDDDCKQIKDEIIHKIYAHVAELSRDKFGSNVVEKCVANSTKKQIDFLLRQLTGKNGGKDLIRMCNDKFANYCVQKVLECCNVKQKKKLIKAIDANAASLRNKHIMDRVKQIKINIQAQLQGANSMNWRR